MKTGEKVLDDWGDMTPVHWQRSRIYFIPTPHNTYVALFIPTHQICLMKTGTLEKAIVIRYFWQWCLFCFILLRNQLRVTTCKTVLIKKQQNKTKQKRGIFIICGSSYLQNKAMVWVDCYFFNIVSFVSFTTFRKVANTMLSRYTIGAFLFQKSVLLLLIIGSFVFDENI